MTLFCFRTIFVFSWNKGVPNTNKEESSMALKQVAITEKAYEVLNEKVREIKESGKSSSAVALVSELIIDNFSKEQAKA